MPYGPYLPPGAEDDGQERGLLFLAVVVDPGRQFEFVQTEGSVARCLDPAISQPNGAGPGLIGGRMIASIAQPYRDRHPSSNRPVIASS